LSWLENRTATQSARAEPLEGLGYPLFTASYAAQVFAHAGDPRRATFWADLVERLRISPAMGWPSAAAECGAWSDAPVPPQLPSGTWPPPDMLAPNISATRLGLHAMIAAGRRDRTAPALPFLAHCQNFATGADAQFDDGGFFFAVGDPVRNKAGIAGRDAGGRERYHSYGSATCDGVLALEACGVAPDDPRQRAAFAWLRQHAAGMRHSGVWASDRADEGESLRFYHAQAFSAVLALAAKSTALLSWAAEQRRTLTAELLAGQSRDGSWAGACPHSFEDDPLIATAFAIRALVQAA
jgi:hypothetical protein